MKLSTSLTNDLVDAALLLDDGEYVIELATGEPSRLAPALLRQRCYEGITTPDGMESIGRVRRDDRGLWAASIDASYDEQTGRDVREVAVEDNRVAAIAALWQARRSARCRHQDC